VIVVAVGLVLAAIAVPVVQGSLQYFALRSAASSATGAIQATRYQAIFNGCPYQVVFSKANARYQVQGKIADANGNCAAGFTDVGIETPLSGSPVTLNQDTTLMFRPSGLTQATVGTMTMTLSYYGQTKTITVTGYGNTKVTP
jgi:Tfp pilus assembly protein FimT